MSRAHLSLHHVVHRLCYRTTTQDCVFQELSLVHVTVDPACSQRCWTVQSMCRSAFWLRMLAYCIDPLSDFVYTGAVLNPGDQLITWLNSS